VSDSPLPPRGNDAIKTLKGTKPSVGPGSRRACCTVIPGDLYKQQRDYNAMRFDKLLTSAGLDAKCSTANAEVTAVVYDSRQAGPGACFVAVRGWKSDGHDFIPAAVEAGCSSVMSESSCQVRFREQQGQQQVEQRLGKATGPSRHIRRFGRHALPVGMEL